MRNLHVLLFLSLVTMAVAIGFVVFAGDAPQDAASEFFHRVRTGNIAKILRAFGDNSCHCAPPGGYVSYLRYESGQDPGIAFMVGQEFKVGAIKSEPMAADDDKYEGVWDKPENILVTTRIEFADPVTQPMFLPLDTAFGYQISTSKLDDFVADPRQGWWKGFSLRLRRSLSPDLIGGQPRGKKQDKDKTEAEILAEHGYLPAEALRYLYPKGPGAVVDASGVPLSASALAARLPRLKSVGIQLKVVRRGSWSRWLIHKVGITSPVLSVNGKDLPLVDPEPPEALAEPESRPGKPAAGPVSSPAPATSAGAAP